MTTVSSSGDETPAVKRALLARLRATVGAVVPATVRWKNFLTAQEDATVNGVTFMSRPEEYHAAGVGFATTLFVVATYVLGVPLTSVIAGAGGGILVSRMVRQYLASGHFSDALKEPAYAALGIVLALGIAAVAFLASHGVPI